MILRCSAWRSCFKLLACSAAAAGLTLAGCTSETVPSSPSNRAAQQESALKGADQGAKTKSGKRSGPTIVAKSVKALIKKDAQE